MSTLLTSETSSYYNSWIIVQIIQMLFLYINVFATILRISFFFRNLASLPVGARGHPDLHWLSKTFDPFSLCPRIGSFPRPLKARLKGWISFGLPCIPIHSYVGHTGVALRSRFDRHVRHQEPVLATPNWQNILMKKPLWNRNGSVHSANTNRRRKRFRHDDWKVPL